ncbi:MAG TPA: hypothetical protein VFI69_11435 [Candidatus Limnocylindrales bacterium]|nr:hypothetical protein [Candidatus Limnocylindrales bacterium]
MSTEPRRDPTADPNRTEGLDPGAFIGHEREREAQTIPGGVGPKDERIAANSTQSGSRIEPDQPAGHREGAPADDDATREAGQDR